MKYIKEGGYTIAENVTVQTGIRGFAVGNDFVRLDTDGQLHLVKKYSWDGMSGPVPNTKRNAVASLVHDGLCQLLREGLLPAYLREEVDLEFRHVLINSGTWLLVAQGYYLVVREFGEKVIFSRAQRIQEAF